MANSLCATYTELISNPYISDQEFPNTCVWRKFVQKPTSLFV